MKDSAAASERPDVTTTSTARRPTQKRAKQRYDQILDEANKILNEQGISGFSIPVIAERLDITRGSIYSYFPTPNDILNKLAERYLDDMEKMFTERVGAMAALEWQDAVRDVVRQAVLFYKDRPVARLLILGAPVTDESYRAQEFTIKRMALLARQIYPDRGAALPANPDVATLAIDMAVTCFRRSVFEHGKITPEYEAAAVYAMRSYLGHYMKDETGG